MRRFREQASRRGDMKEVVSNLLYSRVLRHLVPTRLVGLLAGLHEVLDLLHFGCEKHAFPVVTPSAYADVVCEVDDGFVLLVLVKLLEQVPVPRGYALRV